MKSIHSSATRSGRCFGEVFWNSINCLSVRPAFSMERNFPPSPLSVNNNDEEMVASIPIAGCSGFPCTAAHTRYNLTFFPCFHETHSHDCSIDLPRCLFGHRLLPPPTETHLRRLPYISSSAGTEIYATFLRGGDEPQRIIPTGKTPSSYRGEPQRCSQKGTRWFDVKSVDSHRWF